MMSGLLNLTDDPQTLGLLSLGLRLMSNPSRRFGAALGQSGLGAIGDVQQAQSAQEQRRAAMLREQLVKQQIEQGSLQLDAGRREAELARLPGQFYKPASEPGQDPIGGMDTAMEAPRNQAGPGAFDAQGYAQALMGKDPKAGFAFQQLLRKPEVTPLVSKPGDVARDPRTGAVMWQNPEAPKPGDSSSLGQLLKEYAALPPDSPMRAVYMDAIKKATTHAPAASMHNYGTPQAGMLGDMPVFLTTDKTGAVKILEGVRPPKSAAETKAEQEQAERARQSQQMLSVMDQAKKLLETGSPTGSGVGAAADVANRFLGVTTPSAQTAGQLEALSGWLVANVPRMEGPQSNFDVDNYKTMAGKVGMRDVPVAERLAALKVVNELQRKYAAINVPTTPPPKPGGAPPPKPGSGGNVIKFDAQGNVLP